MSQAYKRHVKKPMTIRLSTQVETIARLLLLGWSAAQIARHLQVTPERIRYTIAKPEFQALAMTLHKEHMATLDRRISRLLYSAVKALSKNLKSSDWRCRASAIEQVLKMHGRFLEKIAVSGTIDHQHQHAHAHAVGILAEPDMTDRQRELTRELLASVRRPRALPPGLQADPESQPYQAQPATTPRVAGESVSVRPAPRVRVVNVS